MSDIIGKTLGNFGIWQLRAILIIFLCKIPASWFMACIIFTAPAPRQREWYCKPPSELLENSSSSKFDFDKWINVAHPKYTNKYNKIEIDHCHIYEDAVNRFNNNSIAMVINNKVNISSDKLIDCNHFEYLSNFYSLLMQFNLVCDRDILLAWSQYWHLFGILIGSVMAIRMMIFMSPRKVMLSGMISQIICGILTGFLPDFNLNCLFRVNSAICCAIMFVSGQAIFQDITGGKYRIGVTTLYDTFWSVGLFLLPGLSNFFNNWSFIYVGITLPTIVLIILYPWIPDSPRWLLKNGLIDQCEKLLIKSIEINDREHILKGIDLKQELQNEYDNIKLQLNDSNNKNIKWLDLWKTPRDIRNCIVIHLAWAIYIINFMGLLLNIRSYPNGREYLGLNTIITGISEVIGCFLAMHFSCNTKHKWTYSGIFNIFAGLIGCFGWIFPNTWDDLTAMSMWMLISSIAKCGVSFALSMLAACTAELMLPEKRPIFIFSCIVWSRAWLLTAPFIGVFKRVHIALSLSAYCVLGIIGGICLLLIQLPKSNSTILATTSCQLKSDENGHKDTKLDERNIIDNKKNVKVWTVPDNVVDN